MRKEIGIFDCFSETIAGLNGDGVFLVTGKEGTAEKINVMTIGWGTIGRIWGKPIFIVMVRPSRFSFLYIEENGDFSVNIPIKDMKEKLEFCGNNSGRDTDKIAKCGFTMEKGIRISVPYIKECSIHYECRTVHKNRVDTETLKNEIISEYYSSDDFHTIYFGEILGVFREEVENISIL